MKIRVVGGGPAGLYFAMLMKKRTPALDIVVYEQNPADATYGWGVVFSNVALNFLRDVDPEFFADFTRGHETCDYMEIVHKGAHVPLRGNLFSRVSRIDLLRVLQDHCRRVGVDVRYGERIGDLAELGDADLIVGTDGLNSMVRTQLADRFKPSFEVRRNKFAWYGTPHLFHPVSLIFRETPHGVFIAHAYQYSPTMSTFLVELSPETWKCAGLDTLSDEESCRLCAEVFAEDLGGQPLLSNRSTWFNSTVVRNERWSAGNVVLMGDALRTIHFSLGSGTRMAMQDAIALYTAMVETGDDVPAALGRYEELRRPSSSDFSEAASRSLDWYETVETKMDLSPIGFAYDYMMRTGRVTPEALRERDPDLVAAAVAERAEPVAAR